MELTFLGTGNARSVNFYNTCFLMSENGQHLLVDAGGGNTILRLLRDQGVALEEIHHVFVSHAHTDHLLGVIWVVRVIGQIMADGTYQGDLRLYGHQEVMTILRDICCTILNKRVTKLFGSRIHFQVVEDGQELQLLGGRVRCFDILSTKMKQFGFLMETATGQRIAFCGDEPLRPQLHSLVRGSDWMLLEAFCLYDEREIFKPYEKNHSTVKEACELASSLDVKHLVLYHTEDSHPLDRQALYTAEGQAYFPGPLYVPDDGQRLSV